MYRAYKQSRELRIQEELNKLNTQVKDNNNNNKTDSKSILNSEDKKKADFKNDFK